MHRQTTDQTDLIAPRALEWLRTTQQPRLLQAHRVVWNLVNEQGNVLALVTPSAGMQPFGWQIAPARLAQLAPDAAIAVDRAAQRLTIGHVMMVAADASVWQPRPEWEQLRNRPLAPPDLSLLPSRVQAGLVQLVHAIRDAAADTIADSVAQLAGFGHGLTPTGDDVLIGVLHALAVWRTGSPWPATIAAAAAPRTTTLATAFLRAAAAGEASAAWHALARGEPGALAHLLATGAHSGREAWAGFCYAGRILD